jgi:hypothetical protein
MGLLLAGAVIGTLFGFKVVLIVAAALFIAGVFV